jgi:hypothetical protein
MFRLPGVTTTRTGTRVASAVLRVHRLWALLSTLHRPASMSAAKSSPPPRLPTAGDRRQGHTIPDKNSAAHPGCRGLWLVKRKQRLTMFTAVGVRETRLCDSIGRQHDQQLRVGRPRHACTQLTRCRVASNPNGLRLLQGTCEPSRSMLSLRARATRVRGVPQPFRASKGSAIEAGAGEGEVTTILRRAQAYSVVGRAVECMRREEPRGKMPLAGRREHGRGGCGGQTTADTPGAPSTARRPLFIA